MQWFRHDMNAHDDIKIKKLLRKFGFAGLGVYWYLMEILYCNDGKVLLEDATDELDLFDSGIDSDALIKELEKYNLIYLSGDMIGSHRVDAEILLSDQNHQKRADAGRKGGLAKSSNAKAMLKQNLANSSTEQNSTEQNITENSSYKNIPHLLSNKKDSCKLADTHKNASTPDGVPAPAPHTFITLISNKSEEIPIDEKMVLLWEKTYPAVNVRAELQKMKSWCISNPTLRKTAQGMLRFCDNWLKKEQDRSGKFTNKPETIKGTNIPMSLVADGTRPDSPEPEVHFD